MSSVKSFTNSTGAHASYCHKALSTATPVGFTELAHGCLMAIIIDLNGVKMLLIMKAFLWGQYKVVKVLLLSVDTEPAADVPGTFCLSPPS